MSVTKIAVMMSVVVEVATIYFSLEHKDLYARLYLFFAFKTHFKIVVNAVEI